MTYLILALATWRISSLLVNEDGPWSMFTRLRAAVGVRYDEDLQRQADNVVAGAFTCIWCMSVWAGLGWSMVLLMWPQVTVWLALPLALSAAAIGADRYVASR